MAELPGLLDSHASVKFASTFARAGSCALPNLLPADGWVAGVRRLGREARIMGAWRNKRQNLLAVGRPMPSG